MTPEEKQTRLIVLEIVRLHEWRERMQRLREENKVRAMIKRQRRKKGGEPNGQ